MFSKCTRLFVESSFNDRSNDCQRKRQLSVFAFQTFDGQSLELQAENLCAEIERLVRELYIFKMMSI